MRRILSGQYRDKLIVEPDANGYYAITIQEVLGGKAVIAVNKGQVRKLIRVLEKAIEEKKK